MNCTAHTSLPSRSDVRRYSVGRLSVSAIGMTQVLQLLDRRVHSHRPAYVCAANLEAAALAQRDRAFCEIENRSLLTVPDGMPLVWCAWIQGESQVQRVTGPDLLIEVLGRSAQQGHTHYFYGDTPETLRRLELVVRDRFPGVVLKGMCSPPFREWNGEELRAAVGEINRLQPSFVWVGLGCPKQERWMAEALPLVESAVLIGVGAAFRFLLGQYRHPPRICQLCGLEGIFWRAWRYPLMGLKWYGGHAPVCGRLLLDAMKRRTMKSKLLHRGHKPGYRFPAPEEGSDASE
jgi:N-acetylglucosaminyldiphosphoundecaprenol N-acetyl-beta-D-mannosaminyltransferase